ncbi:AlwI family type II restriction endonuclease [Aneurinibacillus migulanus]|uniref:AlwI restriction endonuclease n=1 Tax=Aneurinibacillus migulanus TaxID=47500 RepID=A0A0D1XER5_ANEMI|nr:AlwI family type II restriction endonuclease [Aneurinibacillus migulanus]KIV52896.1 restriction endonuclease AlwI [Aneurinibacillus migulanus]KON95173.1 restriction endonuclease AlwI [Aneurinibacillus migulanus]MED0890908.1 AlwI family type II restriction endonuclease [Aneurinibacillus migulanus]MED1616600.1 AlwI family type II restriction endonuclease [Aneurinibacillus migulanus]SDI82292.1 AlwI restriction endonuclease [Aneurinibacillus migulanus]
MTERKVWFITRPERDPKFHREALLALQKATNGFTVKWSGNRTAHLAYEQALADAEVKRPNISNDGSGGRTWAAMLKTFAYCYTNEEGYLVPTKVGEALLKRHKVFDNVKKQILTLQIPNAYFLEAGFRPKFDESFRIRPARFLIRLVNQEELAYHVTKEEITFFALTASKDSQLSEITAKIKAFRVASSAERLEMKADIAAQYDHRERTDKGARDFETAHSDVAHTFMLICDATGMVEYIRGQSLRVNPEENQKLSQELEELEARYPFNNRYKISLERMAENNGLDVESYKASRNSGKGQATNAAKRLRKINEIMNAYPNPAALPQEELERILAEEVGPREAQKYAFELKESQVAFSGLNTEFVESYLYEEDNLRFEDKTGEVLKAIGFDVEMRPKPASMERTEIEIMVKYGDRQCGIIDAKNYRQKFALSASLTSHMASEYIPNYQGYKGLNVQFFGYVTAADFSGEKNLEKISNKVQEHTSSRDIKGLMLSAKVLLGFLDYCLENDIPENERVNLFIRAVQNRGYKTLGEMLKEAKY